MLVLATDLWLSSDSCISIFGCPAKYCVVLGARTTKISSAILCFIVFKIRDSSVYMPKLLLICIMEWVYCITTDTGRELISRHCSLWNPMWFFNADSTSKLPAGKAEFRHKLTYSGQTQRLMTYDGINLLQYFFLHFVQGMKSCKAAGRVIQRTDQPSKC